MTRLKYGLKVLYSSILACMLVTTSCKVTQDVVEGHNTIRELELGTRMVTITVKADSNITIKEPNTFQAEENINWAVIKAKALQLVEAKEGFHIKTQWKRDSASGDVLSDSDVFLSDATVYAESEALPEESKQAKITVSKEGSNITLLDTNYIIAEKNVTKWSDIKAEAEAKLKFADGWELQSWKRGSATGTPLLDNDTFTGDETVFAIAKQKPKAPGNGGGTGGGNNPNQPNPNEQYNVTFSLLKGRDLGSLSGVSIKARKLPDGEEKTSAFIANKGDKIEFTVTLKPETNVEEWKVNGNTVEYGTASYTVTVDGFVNVTALVEKSQFWVRDYSIMGYTGNTSKVRTTANGTFVFPSKIGSHEIAEIKEVTNLDKASKNALSAYIADGIVNITAQCLVGRDRDEKDHVFNMRSIRLPNTLVLVGDTSLQGLPVLISSIHIPKSVKIVGNCSISRYRLETGFTIYFEGEDIKFDDKWYSHDYPGAGSVGKAKVFVRSSSLVRKLKGLVCAAFYDVDSNTNW